MKIDAEITAIGGRDGDAERARELSCELPRLAITDGGWSALHFDPDDGRFWEYTYPESELHGGGPPLLRVLSEEEARKKYGESTMADPRLSKA